MLTGALPSMVDRLGLGGVSTRKEGSSTVNGRGSRESMRRWQMAAGICASVAAAAQLLPFDPPALAFLRILSISDRH